MTTSTTRRRASAPHLHVEVPGAGYHRELVSCQQACPVRTDARGYVRAIADGRFDDAYLIARGPNPFASICGRICGAPCEAACRRGRIPRVDAEGRYLGDDRPVAIRALKRVASEQYGADERSPDRILDDIREHVPGACADAEEMAALVRSRVRGGFEPATGEPVAIVGGGPAGLSAAHDLALLGFKPIVYESERVAAGMLHLGVPAYRLPRDLIRHEVAVIEALGVEIRYGTAVGDAVTFEALRREHAAVIVAVGAKRSRSLELEGERGPFVYGGVDVLRSIALDEPIDLGSDVVVIGGGNVAYDVARTVLRQAAYDAARAVARLPRTRTVSLVSLEGLEEMPADTIEIVEGDEEGIRRINGWGPLEIQREGARVIGVVFRRCLRVYDDERRFSPIFDDQQQTVPCDTVLLATGQVPDLSFLHPGGEDIEEARPGWPRIDQNSLATTAPGVFVAGDLAHGTRLLIDAVASGKRAARSVYQYVTGRTVHPRMVESYLPIERYRRELGYETLRRVEVPALHPKERLDDPSAVVEIGFDPDAATREASRCLDCGVTPVFDGSRCVLCGGCADVCPTQCLKLVALSRIVPTADLDACIERSLGSDVDIGGHSAIVKDEDRCIRCGLCEQRCPVQAISMERVCFAVDWQWNGGARK